MRTLPALASVCALLLAACTTVGPDYKLPGQAAINRPEANATFDAANEASFSSEPLPPHWWQLYQNPDLNLLIERALAANKDLKVAQANLERSRAVLDQVEDAKKPEMSVKAAPGYGRPSAVALAQPHAFPDFWLYDVGTTVSYEVDLFGKIHRAIEAAGSDVQAEAAALDLARVTVAADTARAYAGACAAGQQLAVAKHSLQLHDDFVALTDKRVHAGRGTALDLSRARSQREQVRATLPPLVAQQRVALFRLAVLTGEVPGKLPASLSQCAQIPKLDRPIPVGDGAALLRRRPDIRQAERRLAGATARVGVATADLYPSISLGLSVGSTGLLEQFGAGNAFRWSVGPLISWTLPNTGPARSRVAQARAGNEAALASFDATVLKALQETESALTVYARELDRNSALKEARDQSALAARQAQTLFQYGRTDFLTALDAERTLANSESALSTSDAQIAADQLALFLALGGGWEGQAPPR